MICFMCVCGNIKNCKKMKSSTIIILLLLIFTFSVSSGVARQCCWDVEKSVQHSDQIKSDNELEPCHTKSEPPTTDTENNSHESNDCCYDMIECQLQVIKISKAVSVSPSSYTLIQLSSINNFISNTVEPLKHPPKVLL